MNRATPRIGLVVFDWAGTIVDFGCFAPVTPFIEGFRGLGVEATVVACGWDLHPAGVLR